MIHKKKHIHFIGIGGIGMSGLAIVLKQSGHKISGCDIGHNNPITNHLKQLGCTIYSDHHESHLHNIDQLVFSSDIDKYQKNISKKNNIEIQTAIKHNIPVLSRGMMLAELVNNKPNIIVAGSHGKTTTSSLIAHIILQSGIQPTILIGGILKNIGTNALKGTTNLVVAEADESDKSFLFLKPTIAVITNIDTEHLDVYSNLQDVQHHFKQFLNQVSPQGKIIVCRESKEIREIIPSISRTFITYGFDEKCDLQAKIHSLNAHESLFSIYSNNPLLAPLGLISICRLSLAGKHNVLNALASIIVGLELKIPLNAICLALASFKGVKRRFEFKGFYKGATIFDDYGHHPTEIKCTLDVALKHKKKKLFIIFQPHRFSRTSKLWSDFINTFSASFIDYLYITDIYPANEQPIENINSYNFVEELKKRNPSQSIFYCSNFNDVINDLKTKIEEEDVILTLGAGKAHTIWDMLNKENMNEK